jgi:hypothetical protein
MDKRDRDIFCLSNTSVCPGQTGERGIFSLSQTIVCLGWTEKIGIFFVSHTSVSIDKQLEALWSKLAYFTLSAVFHTNQHILHEPAYSHTPWCIPMHPFTILRILVISYTSKMSIHS